MESIALVTLASVFNRNREANEEIIRLAIQSAVDHYGIFPLIQDSLSKTRKQPLAA